MAIWHGKRAPIMIGTRPLNDIYANPPHSLYPPRWPDAVLDPEARYRAMTIDQLIEVIRDLGYQLEAADEYE